MPDWSLAIVGGGPAGLRAAESAAAAGVSVCLFDSMPSVGRKFLVAGKGGLNLTKSQALPEFTSHYTNRTSLPAFWQRLIESFPPDALREWAHSLGVETFAASTGRVYPTAMRSAPLLRRWVQRLRSLGVRFAMRHRLRALRLERGIHLQFHTPSGTVEHTPEAAILALGGGSWPQTGSDGTWFSILSEAGIPFEPLLPANCGWECPWPEELLPLIEGQPLKAIRAGAGPCSVLGELLVTRYGLEGGALYQLGATLRKLHPPLLTIDFKPHSTHAQLLDKIRSARKNLLSEARRLLRLNSTIHALLSSAPLAELHQDARFHSTSAESLVSRIKDFRLQLRGTRPIEEAISSAGGVRFEALDESLMFREIPGLFAAGEMLDWEAPTGGYLLQGCFASGTHAGKSAAAWLQRQAAGRSEPS